MNIVIPSVLLGVISSIITEIFKFIPWLAATDTRKQVTAFLVTLLFVLGYIASDPEICTASDAVGIFFLSLTVAYSTFKTVLKGLSKIFGCAERLNEI